jgi:electron transport complex protein RnfE
LTTTVILVLSNMMISALRSVIPDRVRIPSYIVVVATFVTIVQFLLEAYLPSLNDSLGLYIPLIVVNCIILGRAESYASKHGVMLSLFDGLGMGLGFTIGLTAIGIFREWLGNGTIFNVKMMPSAYEPITIFVLAPGAFFVLAFLVAVINRVNRSKAAKTGAAVRCAAGCAGCASAGICGGHGVVESAVQADTKQEQEGGK